MRLAAIPRPAPAFPSFAVALETGPEGSPTPRPGPAQLLWSMAAPLLDAGRYGSAAALFEAYLEEFPHGDEITIHHLLSHTSGMANYMSHPDYPARMHRIRSIADALPLVLDQELVFERFRDGRRVAREEEVRQRGQGVSHLVHERRQGTAIEGHRGAPGDLAAVGDVLSGLLARERSQGGAMGQAVGHIFEAFVAQQTAQGRLPAPETVRRPTQGSTWTGVR